MSNHIQKCIKTAVILFLIFTVKIISAQGITENFPQTPEASTLGKFVEIPVGKFTGTVNTSIPIYLIEVDDIQIPIELNYHSSGIKINDIASRVGLGWSLNHGGYISKETVGFPDIVRTRPHINPSTFNPNGGTIPAPNNDTNIILESLGYNYGMVTAQPIDTQPDLYNFNLPGHSGSFSYSSNGNAIITPQTDLKLLSDNLGVNNFNFLDSQGNRFEFWPVNSIQNITINQSINHLSLISFVDKDSWGIRKIVTKNKQEITFEYGKSTHTIVQSNNIIKKSHLMFAGGSGCTPHNFNNGTYAFTPKRRLINNLLSKINFPNGYIKFLYSDDVSNQQRLDVENDVYLEKIEVYNLNDNLLREYKLNYDYFYYNSLSQNFDANRLKLTSVNENISGQNYSFEYYNDTKIPKRLSNAQDRWGHISSKSSGNGIPSIFFDNRYYEGVNRNVDEENVFNGLLKQVVYPTKGITKFFYELDDYYTSWIEEEVDNGIFRLTTYGDPNGNTGVNNYYKQDITITDEMFDNELIFANSRPEGSTEPLSFPMPCNGNILNKDTGHFVFGVGGLNTSLNEVPIDLSPGNYELRIFKNDDDNCLLHVKYKTKKVEHFTGNRKGGGIRIKEIISEDLVTGSKLVKKYNYNLPGTERSSGVMLGKEPSFTKYRTDYVGSRNVLCTYLDLQNYPSNPYPGKPIAYEYVTEINYDSINNNSNSILTKYKVLPKDVVTGGTHATFDTPIENRGFQRGLPLTEILFDVNNDTILKKEFKYNFSNSFNIDLENYTGYDKVAHGLVGRIDQMEHNNPIFIWDFYYIRNLWVQDTLIKTTNYVNGQPSLIQEEIIDYQSGSPKHTFPISKTTANSIGENLRTEYYYPPDLTTSYEQSSLMNKLKGRNQIASPVITKTFQNGTPTSEQRTHYAHFYESSSNPDAGFILPQYVYAKKGEIGTTSQPQDKKITYDYYDEKGNLTEYTLESGIPVSIIWGYNKQYPIAKVEGLRNSEIATFITTLQGLSNSGTLVSTSFDGLRTAINATNKYAVLTSYIYKPLIGVTEIISPNGQKETYEYDASGRLMHVKDHQGNILKKIDYYFRP